MVEKIIDRHCLKTPDTFPISNRVHEELEGIASVTFATLAMTEGKFSARSALFAVK